MHMLIGAVILIGVWN